MGDVFKISKIQLTIPVTFKITDYNGEEIQSSFYEQELQKTKQDILRIANIIKQHGNKTLVKWMGNNDSFNSWVDNKNINKLLDTKSIMFALVPPPVFELAIFASTI